MKMSSSEDGRKEIVKVRTQLRSSHQQKSSYLDAPLHMISCIASGNAEEITHLLLNFAADVRRRNREGCTPLQMLLQMKDPSYTRCMLLLEAEEIRAMKGDKSLEKSLEWLERDAAGDAAVLDEEGRRGAGAGTNRKKERGGQRTTTPGKAVDGLKKTSESAGANAKADGQGQESEGRKRKTVVAKKPRPPPVQIASEWDVVHALWSGIRTRLLAALGCPQRREKPKVT